MKKLPKECRLVTSVEVNEIYLAVENDSQMMLIDCGCPKTMIGRKQLEAYLKSQGFTIESLETRESEVSHFRFGETVYDSNDIINYQSRLKTLKAIITLF